MADGNHYFEANRAVMARFLPSQYTNVLEVGCASGGFAKHLPLAKDLWGVEPDSAAAERAKTHYQNLLCGLYDNVSSGLPDGYFDLVICNDVIEHMPDHEAFFAALRCKLKPGAFMVGSLPNVRHITALAKLLLMRDWPYGDSGILDRTHLRFFTEKSIKRFFAEQSVELEAFEGVGSVIRHGLVRPANPLSPIKSVLLRAGAASVVVGTLGFYADTQYPQFGFRIRF